MTFSPVEVLMSLDLSFTMHPKTWVGTSAKWLQMEINIQALILMVKVMKREILSSIVGKYCATKGWLHEFLAFEGPCSPNKISESLAPFLELPSMRQAV